MATATATGTSSSSSAATIVTPGSNTTDIHQGKSGATGINQGSTTSRTSLRRKMFLFLVVVLAVGGLGAQ